MLILVGGRRPAMAASRDLPEPSLGWSAPGVVDVWPVADVSYTLHAPYRDVLASRDLPAGDVGAEEALAHWRDKADHQAWRQWMGGGRQSGGGAGVNLDGLYECSEVRLVRDRAWLAQWRKDVRVAARNRGRFTPPPSIETGEEGVPEDREELLAYGRACQTTLLAKKIQEAEKTDEGLLRLARAEWGAWSKLFRAMPPIRDVLDRSYWKILPHHAFWSLVADERPIVLSARTGRLIDGLRRLQAHAAAGHRSPGVPVVRRDYADDAAEFEDVIRLNASNPALPQIERVRLAELLRPAYRKQAARNSGRPGGEFTDMSGSLPKVGRRGGRLKKRSEGKAVRVNERLADVAGMSRDTYERYLHCL